MSETDLKSAAGAKPFFLTTPLYYVNAKPHMGHTYSTIVADVVTRFHRQAGEEAYYLTGTDEHGQKIQRAAEKAGVSPQQFTDAIAGKFRREWDRLGLRYDFFIRTTEARHTAAVLELFELLKSRGYIYKGTYQGAYCVFDELFIGEIEAGMPCPECGRPTELVSEENYYFKLSAFAEPLKRHIQQHPDFIHPETRRNEVLSFLDQGLRDLSVTRTAIHWGIPVPGDEKHVLYVWLDALTGYMSGIGFGSSQAADRERFNHLWPAWHLVGKEIVRFHCVYWPAFLMAVGLPLPRGVVAHGWLLFNNTKMSKSVGNIVPAGPIAEVVGIDALRYFLLREISFGSDGNFSTEAVIARYNSDLANGWGNLASRTLAMIAKYRDGLTPSGPADASLGALAVEARQQIVSGFGDWQFARGLEAIWRLIAGVDGYLVKAAPWKLAENKSPGDSGQLDATLCTAAEALRWTAVLLAPVLPESAAKLWRQLGFTGSPAGVAPASLDWDKFPGGQRIGALEPLFPRLDKAPSLAKIHSLEEALEKEPILPVAPPAPATATPAASGADGKITIDDFAKVELRVGTVVTAERIAGADKLLKLTVDIGTEVRQIVAGIAEAYDPASLPGRKVVIVANLAPRKLRGVESNGMIVAASFGEKGTPALVSVPENVPNGARLK